MLTFISVAALLSCSVLADQSVVSAVFRSSHNSYSGDVDGQKGTIQRQLDAGVRMIEFDLWDNDYSSNGGYRIGHSGPGNAVDHTSPNPSSSLLRDWLTTVNTWSSGNPTHAPIQVMIDLKSDLTDNSNFAAGNPAALNQVFKDVFGDRLVWAGTAPTGLPSLDALRGRIIPVLSGNGETRSQYRSDNGANPAVARNNRGHVVEVHDDGAWNLWYWSGKVQSNGEVKWLRHGKYDTGLSPAITINDDGWIVEVHKSQSFSTVFSRVGKFDDATAEIAWYSSSKFDNGVSPSVAFVGAGLREVHQSQSNSQRWTWSGALDTSASPPIVRWSGNARTDDPFYAKTESNGVAVYRDSAGKVAYSSGSIVGRRVAYEQIFFVEFQPGNGADLADALVYAGPSSDTGFITDAKNKGKLVRSWDFDSASDATTPFPNYAATNHPYEAWYESLMTTNKAVK